MTNYWYLQIWLCRKVIEYHYKEEVEITIIALLDNILSNNKFEHGASHKFSFIGVFNLKIQKQ